MQLGSIRQVHFTFCWSPQKKFKSLMRAMNRQYRRILGLESYWSYVLFLSVSEKACVYFEISYSSTFSKVPIIFIDHLRELEFWFSKGPSIYSYHLKQWDRRSASCSCYKYFKWVFWKRNQFIAIWESFENTVLYSRCSLV